MGLLKGQLKSKYFDKLDRLDDILKEYDKYCATSKTSEHLINWFIEVVYKNTAIYKSKFNNQEQDQETFTKLPNHIYWIDFGKTIGSEFQDLHFAVVLSQSKYTAIVIPLTSKKEVPPTWTENTNYIVNIGEVLGFPNECKECLAFTGGIQTVSKKRLSKYRDTIDRSKYYDIEISNSQMNLIRDNIANEICGIVLTSV